MLTYSELVSIPDFIDRLNYCCLRGKVSELTFGHNRYLNQVLYHSPEWRTFKRDMIIRDNGCNLAHEDYAFGEHESVYLHHLNPITVDDVIERRSCVFSPENVVCVSFLTHQHIHYGLSGDELKKTIAVRRPNDTCPWR